MLDIKINIISKAISLLKGNNLLILPIQHQATVFILLLLILIHPNKDINLIKDKQISKDLLIISKTRSSGNNKTISKGPQWVITSSKGHHQVFISSKVLLVTTSSHQSSSKNRQLSKNPKMRSQAKNSNLR